MIVLKGFIEVPQDELEIIKQALDTHIQLTQKEPGCITFTVSQRSDEPSIFDVYEEFVDKDSFSAHQERVKNSHWGAVTKNVKRVYEISGLD